jgi:hypothetical protein
VPSGCGLDALEINSPVAASLTTIFTDWVEESTPATFLIEAITYIYLKYAICKHYY